MIFVPLLHYFKCKNTYSGNEYGLRYRLTPGKRSVPDPEGGEGAVKEESILTVDYWPDPWTREMTDPALRRQEIFPLTDEGRAAAASCLEDAFNADPERWKNCPDMMDCDPWTPPAPEPMISSLIDCAQTSFARPLTHREMEKLVNLYVQEGFAPETVMLCVAYVASCGKRTMAAVVHELKVWRTEGVETGEQADAHLKLLALRRSREQYVSGLLGISTDELTLGGRKAIARWYEVYGYDDAMVQEAAVQAGPKRDLWYWNSILKTWNAKGLRTIHDVRGPVADAGASRNIRVDREAPSGNDFLGSSSLSASLNRLKKRSNT